MVTKLLSMALLSLMVLGSFAAVDSASAKNCPGGKKAVEGRCP